MMLTVALLQMAACGNDLAASQAKGDEFCRHAATMGADMALFPEMWSTGYTALCEIPDDEPNLWRAPARWAGGDGGLASLAADDLRAVWGDLAIGRDHPFIGHFRELARELNMAIALTYLEHWDPLPRNSMSLIDRHGEIVLTYAKVHTCDFSRREAALTPGDGFYVCDLDTAQGNVRVGAMICYDREFPESARVLMLKGAEIVLTPNACDLEINRLSGFRTRACENMMGMAMTNYAGRTHGHSIAFDGIAYDGLGSRDMLLVEAGYEEGVYLAHFDLERLRDYREREAWGNAFRRPHRYGEIVSMDVCEPFVRIDADGRAHRQTRGSA